MFSFNLNFFQYTCTQDVNNNDNTCLNQKGLGVP